MRQDFSLYNESNMITLHSSTYADIPRSELLERYEELQAKGHGVLISLSSDDGVCLRLVVDEPLTEAEATEWVERQEWHLYVPDGKLGLEGGLDGRFSEEAAIDGEYLIYETIPNGHYHVVIYTYPSSYFGVEVLERLDDNEALGAYFRRTHPSVSMKEMPDWLRYILSEEPDADPGYEDDWEAFADSDAFDELLDSYDEADSPPYIEFLAHLTRIQNEATFEVNPEWLEDREFLGRQEIWMKSTIRRPRICPLGIRSNLAENV